MKEKISRLAKGMITPDQPVLRIAQREIRESVPLGRITRGDFRLYSANQLAFRGLIYSSDTRVHLEQGYFTGTSAVINYEVDGTRLKEGEEIKGTFTLVCNGGEYELPYLFRVGFAESDRLARVKRLEDFAGLAAEDYDLAERIFDSASFSRLPFMKDLAVRAVYDGLRRSNNRRRGLEEFLTGLELKEPVVLSVEDGERYYDVCPEKAEQLVVHRSTWGYVSCTIQSDAPFLHLLRESLTDRDFLGNDAEILYRIDKEQLHQGRNYGSIRITTLGQELVVPVVVAVGDSASGNGRSKREYEKHFVQLMNSYLDYQIAHGDPEENLEKMKQALDAMAKLREPDVRMRLWEAEWAQFTGKTELAGQVLDALQVEAQRRRKEDPDTYCYFLYLQMKQNDSWELKERLLKLLYKYEGEDQATPMVYLLLLRIDDNRTNRPMETLALMRDFFGKGCRSPFLFLEACRIMNQIPETLENLEDFELQALWFGAKHEYIGEKLAHRTEELCLKERNFRPILFHTLELLYQQYPDSGMILAICSLLIRGDKRDSTYFKWFVRGVEADVRLTRLYDYYLYSRPLDLEGELPAGVLLFYSYNSPGDFRSRQLLYDQVLTYYAPDSHMYQAYENQMQRFSVEQLLAGKIDDFLARLYTRMLYPEMIDYRVAEILPDILMTQKIQVSIPGLQYVIVVYGELNEEVLIPIRDGVAYVPVYTDLCRLLFMDGYGNRFMCIPFEAEALMADQQELLAQCRKVDPNHGMLRLAAMDECLQRKTLSVPDLDLIQAGMGIEGLHPLYQEKLISAVIHYHSEQENDTGNMLLMCMDNPFVSEADRKELIQALIAHNYLPEALSQVKKYGHSGLSDRLLLKLCSRTIQNGEYPEDAYLISMAAYLFHHRQYDDTILQYLCRYYNGLSKRMEEILRKAVDRHLDTSDMAERLLGQMLFTGTWKRLDYVFETYIAQGPAERLLVSAYFVVKSHMYFMDPEAPVKDSFFAYLEEALQKRLLAGHVPPICLLALTRRYGEQAELTYEQRCLCQEMVHQLYIKGLCFPYFKKLARFVELPDEICDKTWIEFRGEPDDRVQLKMRVLPEMEDEDMVCTDMIHVYQGIFLKSVLLFVGEYLDYEIEVTRGKSTQTMKKGVLGADITQTTAPNRFAQLNRLSAKGQEPEDEEWQEQIRAYGLQDAMVKRLFGTID